MGKAGLQAVHVGSTWRKVVVMTTTILVAVQVVWLAFSMRAPVSP